MAGTTKIMEFESDGSSRTVLEYRNADGRPIGLNFYYPNNRNQFDSDEELLEDVKEHWKAVTQIRQSLRPGEPDPTTFQDWGENIRYQSQLRVWENKEALEAHYQAHKPPPQSQSMDPDFYALHRGDEKDKEVAKKILRERELLATDLKTLQEFEIRGDTEKAKGVRQRIAMTERAIYELRKGHKYSLIETQEAELLRAGNSELERAMTLPASEIMNDINYWQSLVDAFNNENDGEFTILIDAQSGLNPARSGDSGIIRIDHSGIRGKDIKRDSESHNTTPLEYLLQKGYGNVIETKEKEEKISEETPSEEKDRRETMSQAEFEAEMSKSTGRNF